MTDRPRPRRPAFTARILPSGNVEITNDRLGSLVVRREEAEEAMRDPVAAAALLRRLF
jgi:hypothetical protein